jgi:hypothetical protein
MILIGALIAWLVLVAFFVVLCRIAASADGRDVALTERYSAFPSSLDHPGWDASDYRVVGYVLGDHCTRTDDSALADADPGENRALSAQPCSFADRDWGRDPWLIADHVESGYPVVGVGDMTARTDQRTAFNQDGLCAADPAVLS